MAKNGPTKNAFNDDSTIVQTSGEIFDDGTIVELVKAADQHLELLLWRKNQKTVAPRIEHRGRIYQAPHVNETLLKAIHFPSGAVDYGSPRKLFSGVRDLFQNYIGLAPPEAALLTAWSGSSWFPECVSSPTSLMISGPDMGHGITLLRLLSCLVRRSLILADINRSGLLAVMSLQPTLLVNQSGQFPKLWNLYGTTNFHGVYVPGSQGRVHNLAGSRAFFVGMENTWNDGAVHVALSPAHPALLTLDARRQAEIAKRFQPEFLMYRLRNLRAVRQSHATVCQAEFPDTETAHNLAACIQDESHIAQAIAPILRRQDHEAHIQRGCDVVRVIVEVIWAPLHEKKEIAISRITDLANALLRGRGETLEYSAAEIGWKLRNLGIYRHRNGGGMILRPSRDNSVIVHQLAQRLDLSLSPVPGCVDCVPAEVVVPN